VGGFDKVRKSHVFVQTALPWLNERNVAGWRSAAKIGFYEGLDGTDYPVPGPSRYGSLVEMSTGRATLPASHNIQFVNVQLAIIAFVSFLSIVILLSSLRRDAN
jgi:hypothetical protein